MIGIIILLASQHHVFGVYMMPYCILVVLILLTTTALARKITRSFNLTLLDLFLVLVFFTICTAQVKTDFTSIDQLNGVISFLFLFMISRQVNWSAQAISHIISFLTGITIVESIIGIIQFIGAKEQPHLQLKGWFNSSTLFASYLALIVTLLVGEFRYTSLSLQATWWKWIRGMGASMAMVLIALSQSRAAIAVAFLSICYSAAFTWRRQKSKLNWKWPLIALLSVLICIFVFFMYSKQSSTTGRLVIWRVSKEILLDHWKTGIGVGRFPMTYADYKEQLFAGENFTPEQQYLDDAILYPYNEVLYVGITWGAIALSLLLLGGILLLAQFLRPLKVAPGNTNFGVGPFLIGLTVLSLVGFPLHDLRIALLLAIVLAIISSRVKIATFQLSRSVIIIYVMIAAVSIWFSITKVIPIYQWKTFDNSPFPHASKVAFYEKSYPQLKFNGHFLYQYAQSLYAAGDFKKSIAIFQEAGRYIEHDKVLIFIGSSYAELKDYLQAEHYFLRSLTRYPNRLMPKYQLFKLYEEQGKIPLARKMATAILKHRLKVSSPWSDQVQQSARAFLMETSIFNPQIPLT
ncbi:hypothetical protein HB364_14120 [Pseudoflavitalea sp. X16]|uniref:O-antigen ligase family protein n=1 Tax=Paraflavitalea devenefica TaxID=2716334 RepID=UPI001421696B|nr:O-antigen ligase family protein [Paraflavitalea devenefica]NII26226.1 hypothetical protein [Paraflavitalea devenefica]